MNNEQLIKLLSKYKTKQSLLTKYLHGRKDEQENDLYFNEKKNVYNYYSL